MNRTRLSEYTVLSLAAYITMIGVYFSLFSRLQTAEDRLILTILMLFFAVIGSLFFRFENQPRVINSLLVIETAVLLFIFYLTKRDLDIGTLFFVLSAYAMLFLPIRNGTFWVLLFTLIVGIQAGLSDITTLIAMGGGFAFFGFVGASLRRSDQARLESERLLGELQQAHQQLQEYAAQAEQLAVAEERNRLAREMHDALGHRLTVAVVQLEGAQRLIPTEPERAANMVGTMREQLKTALHELRQTVSALRTPAQSSAEEDLPLPTAIQRLASNFQSATSLNIHLALPTDLPPLPATHRLTLYRAAQECLTNIQRHATANQVWLDLAAQNGTVTLTITDDGKGFPAVIGEGHFGLEGLRERTEQLGGRIQWQNQPNGGAQIHLQIPINGSSETE